ncbi:hypothetical protein QYE76_051101 [Lolium multiflorum]|uniref:BTB domain-containing protein n=1 Tax=Lolium multiflorum TaxID=4521 RepID=A0AAD8SSR6_LOLMU|nr:hypothetical protein QYE76_051101 [Lolium multiflorum]
MESSGYVVDDRFTLKCALTVIKEPYVIEDHIEVPPSDITEQLRKLLDAKEGADVTFEVQGEVFRAHKLVLAMRSPVFKALLYGPMREKDSNRFVIDDMQPAIFKVLLRFIYTDSLPPNMDDDLEGDDKREVTRHLLVAADRYAVERLKLMCESILCKELDDKSVANPRLALGVGYADGSPRRTTSAYSSLGTRNGAVGVVPAVGVRRLCRWRAFTLGVAALGVSCRSAVAVNGAPVYADGTALGIGQAACSSARDVALRGDASCPSTPTAPPSAYAWAMQATWRAAGQRGEVLRRGSQQASMPTAMPSA